MPRFCPRPALVAGALVWLGAAAAGAQTPAQAQNTLPIQRPLRLKIGGLFPSDNKVKDFLGKNVVFAGIGYDFAKTNGANPVTFEAFVDYGERSRTTNVVAFGSPAGARVAATGRLIGGGVAARYLFAPPTQAFQPYAGAGVGVYNVYARLRVSGLGAALDGERTQNATSVGGKLLLGAQVSGGFFGEAEYNFFPKVTLDENNGLVGGGDASLNGYALRLGYRF